LTEVCGSVRTDKSVKDIALISLWTQMFWSPEIKWDNWVGFDPHLCHARSLWEYPAPLMLWVQTPLRRGILDTTLCDQVCQWLATGWWFSPSTLVFSTNKTDRHDTTEILLKVALNTINQPNQACTDCTGSCKSNYHTITTTTPPK
jgi:hypothetical protein